MLKLSSVLLVDDDSTNNFLNQLLFESLGVTDHLLVAESGTQALDLLVNSASPAEPALILLDVNMPGMNGIQFLEAYKRLPHAESHGHHHAHHHHGRARPGPLGRAQHRRAGQQAPDQGEN